MVRTKPSSSRSRLPSSNATTSTMSSASSASNGKRTKKRTSGREGAGRERRTTSRKDSKGQARGKDRRRRKQEQSQEPKTRRRQKQLRSRRRPKPPGICSRIATACINACTTLTSCIGLLIMATMALIGWFLGLSADVGILNIAPKLPTVQRESLIEQGQNTSLEWLNTTTFGIGLFGFTSPHILTTDTTLRQDEWQEIEDTGDLIDVVGLLRITDKSLVQHPLEYTLDQETFFVDWQLQVARSIYVASVVLGLILVNTFLFLACRRCTTGTSTGSHDENYTPSSSSSSRNNRSSSSSSCSKCLLLIASFLCAMAPILSIMVLFGNPSLCNSTTAATSTATANPDRDINSTVDSIASDSSNNEKGFIEFLYRKVQVTNSDSDENNDSSAVFDYYPTTAHLHTSHMVQSSCTTGDGFASLVGCSILWLIVFLLLCCCYGSSSAKDKKPYQKLDSESGTYHDNDYDDGYGDFDQRNRYKDEEDYDFYSDGDDDDEDYTQQTRLSLLTPATRTLGLCCIIAVINLYALFPFWMDSALIRMSAIPPSTNTTWDEIGVVHPVQLIGPHVFNPPQYIPYHSKDATQSTVIGDANNETILNDESNYGELHTQQELVQSSFQFALDMAWVPFIIQACIGLPFVLYARTSLAFASSSKTSLWSCCFCCCCLSHPPKCLYVLISLLYCTIGIGSAWSIPLSVMYGWSNPFNGILRTLKSKLSNDVPKKDNNDTDGGSANGTQIYSLWNDNESSSSTLPPICGGFYSKNTLYREFGFQEVIVAKSNDQHVQVDELLVLDGQEDEENKQDEEGGSNNEVRFLADDTDNQNGDSNLLSVAGDEQASLSSAATTSDTVNPAAIENNTDDKVMINEDDVLLYSEQSNNDVEPSSISNFPFQSQTDDLVFWDASSKFTTTTSSFGSFFLSSTSQQSYWMGTDITYHAPQQSNQFASIGTMCRPNWLGQILFLGGLGFVLQAILLYKLLCQLSSAKEAMEVLFAPDIASGDYTKDDKIGLMSQQQDDSDDDDDSNDEEHFGHDEELGRSDHDGDDDDDESNAEVDEDSESDDEENMYGGKREQSNVPVVDLLDDDDDEREKTNTDNPNTV